MNKKLTKIIIDYMAEVKVAKKFGLKTLLAPPLTPEEVFDDAIDKLCIDVESLTFEEFQAQRSR